MDGEMSTAAVRRCRKLNAVKVLLLTSPLLYAGHHTKSRGALQGVCRASFRVFRGVEKEEFEAMRLWSQVWKEKVEQERERERNKETIGDCSYVWIDSSVESNLLSLKKKRRRPSSRPKRD